MKKKDLDFKTIKGFSELYNTYAPQVFSFFIYNLGEREIAEDLVQELFANIWFKRHSIDIDDSIENYLLRSAKYKLIDHYRKEEKEHVLMPYHNIEKPVNNSPEDLYIFSEIKATIFKVIKKMPRKAREIFFLSRKKGLPHKEIAKNLSVSEKTVEYHIGKTIRRIRRHVS